MYGNFGNPYSNPYPAMQNRLTMLEQQQQQYNRQTMPIPLSGRIVTGIEEARASQIALDGTPSYFPSPAENKIYVKSLDMNGLPVFLTYELKMSNPNMPMDNVQNRPDLESRVEAIENKLKEILNHEPNANATNA